jgi:hypothetical protein
VFRVLGATTRTHHIFSPPFNPLFGHFLGRLYINEGDVGNSLLPYQQILVKAIFSALIGPRWSIWWGRLMKGQLMHSTKLLHFGLMRAEKMALTRIYKMVSYIPLYVILGA